MTNREIIMRNSIQLVKDGKLELVDDLPEAIHTYATWKKLGYTVKKGEKAIAKFTIWKYGTKEVEDENGEVTQSSSMFMKLSAFFKKSQVEKIKDN